QVRGFRGDRGYVLDGAGTGADGRNTLARSRFGVIPTRRVKRPAMKSPGAGNVGNVGDVQHSDRRDDDVELMPGTVRCLQRPAHVAVRPAQGGDAGAGDEVVGEAMVGGDPFEVGQDLRLVGEGL